MLGVMHMLTRRLFKVAFEWRRIGQLVLVVGGLAVAGDLLLPTRGAVGLLTRALAWLAIPIVLYATGFAHAQELRQLRRLAGRVRQGLGGAAA
jgi:hypothetical protein